MRYTKEERQLSYLSTGSNVSGHDRASLDSQDPLSKPSTILSRRQTPRLSEISPLLLKRKRTACDEPQVRRDSSGLTGLSASKDSLRGLPAFSTGAQSNREYLSRQSQTLHSLQASPGHHAPREQSHNDSLMQKVRGPSKAPSKSESSFKPTCRVCDKTTATSYNPIIACPGCARKYHDSCRRPSLTQGVGSQHWRCSICLSDTEKAATPLVSSKPASIRYSAVREVFKPWSARSPAANSSRLPEETTANEHVDTRDFRASSLSARSLESLDRPKEVSEPSPQPELLDLSNSLRTRMYRLSQPDNLDSSSQGQNVEAQVNITATSSSVPVQNSTPPIAPCSACQVRPCNESSHCHDCRRDSNIDETVKRMPEHHGKASLGEATKTTPTKYIKSNQGNVFNSASCPRPSAITSTILGSSFIPSPATTASNGDLPLEIFKLSGSSVLKDMVGYASGIKRETSFHRVYPRSTQSSIEMMTAEEKAMKVAEIQARPSRKALFDSNQRLAHVRRYRRLDIHDESDGAWNTQSSEAEGYPVKYEAVARDCDEPRSLREVFNLPVHAVPMNDGVELAFRDGTMVNGRLPRPRHVYRVGKRLGARLTVN